jgi:hypothetical protein
MLRIVLGIIVGFLVWSILWVGSDQVLTASIGWYGEHQRAFERAMFNREPFIANSTILFMHMVRSGIACLISGYVAALVANEDKRSTLLLGVMVLVAGILIEAMAWNYLPIWYHIVFLVLLIPTTVAGGKLKRFA